MNIINNPIEMLQKVMDEHYPDLKVDIYFGEQETNGVDKLGVTIFPDDGSQPVIEVNPYIPLAHITEIVAHELAHVIAGVEAEHGEAWETEFENISTLFFGEFQKRAEAHVPD